MHSSRGRVTAIGGQTEEKQGLFPSLTAPSLRPEGNFRSSGSSRDSIAAGGDSAYLRGETSAMNSDQLKQITLKKEIWCSYSNCQKGEA